MSATPTDGFLSWADFLPEDGWMILKPGEDAGTIGLPGREVKLTGGRRYQVDKGATVDPDSEGGPTAPPGFVGTLVAVSSLAQQVALSAQGTIHLAAMPDLAALDL